MEITLKKAMELTNNPYTFRLICNGNRKLYLQKWQLPKSYLDVNCYRITYDNDNMDFIYHIDTEYYQL